MAESETRLETLEDEVKVLKGEVKRTLVDLRALLMREDSPLGQRVLTQPEPLNVVAQASDRTLAGPTPEAAPVETGPAIDAVSLSESLPGPGFDLPLDDLPSGPPQDGPGLVPGLFGGDSITDPDDQSKNAEEMPEQLESNHHAPLETGETVLSDEAVRRPHGSNGLKGNGHLAGDGEVPSADTSAPNGRVNSVYDEYRDLLEETRQTHPIEDEPVGPPLDINLLSNLVYWTALAKQLVGEEQLKEILQLYIQSGHSRPELQNVLLQVARMVDADPLSVREGPREWVDLIFHLHGILTGGFPVIKMPHIRLSNYDQTKDAQS